jgi:hypothetical protein
MPQTYEIDQKALTGKAGYGTILIDELSKTAG